MHTQGRGGAKFLSQGATWRKTKKTICQQITTTDNCFFVDKLHPNYTRLRFMFSSRSAVFRMQWGKMKKKTMGKLCAVRPHRSVFVPLLLPLVANLSCFVVFLFSVPLFHASLSFFAFFGMKSSVLHWVQT